MRDNVISLQDFKSTKHYSVIYLFTTTKITTQEIIFHEAVGYFQNLNLLKIIFTKHNAAYVLKKFYYEKIKKTSNIKLGYAARIRSEDVLTEDNINILRQRLEEEFPGVVFFIKQEVYQEPDVYLNVAFVQTSQLLEDFKTQKNIVNDVFPQRSHKKVVVGKLIALQKIKDANGNLIEVPLCNVPIGVLNSEELQELLRLREQKIKLHYLPPGMSAQEYVNTFAHQYFDRESAEFDALFLEEMPYYDDNKVVSIFNDFVLTNEKGEFVIHTEKTGNCYLVYEVNLLKQYLTKDEVELNFYSYNNYIQTSSYRLYQVPHYHFKYLEISLGDLPPCWSTSQELQGYFEVTVKMSLDLRKWVTFFLPPVVYNNMKVDSPEYIQRYSYNKPIQIIVRNMAVYDTEKLQESDIDKKMEVYPTTNIECCVITQVLDKEENHRLSYLSQAVQIVNSIKIYKHGIIAIKLPANIYVPFDVHRDEEGNLVQNKYRNLWLASYQLKVFIAKNFIYYRTTSTFLLIYNLGLNNMKIYDRDHFHLCLHQKTSEWDLLKQTAYLNRGSGLVHDNGQPVYPYEQAWSWYYPEMYKIPKKPQKLNYIQKPQKFPYYQDGEYISSNSFYGFGGIGLSVFSKMFLYTDYATHIHSGEGCGIYKYESLYNHLGETSLSYSYMDGYHPFHRDYESEVHNGEKFQRVEAGYAYLLWCPSLPRLCYFYCPEGQAWGFHPLEVDTTNAFTQQLLQKDYFEITNTVASPCFYWQPTNYKHLISYSVFNNSKDIAIDLYKNKTRILADKLNLYRVINTKQRLSLHTLQPYRKKYSYIIIERVFVLHKPNEKKHNLRNFGAEDLVYIHELDNIDFNFIITNHGEIEQEIGIEKNNSYQTYVLQPGQKLCIYYGNKLEWSGSTDFGVFFDFKKALKIRLTSNYEYNEEYNNYEKTVVDLSLFVFYKPKNTSRRGILRNIKLFHKNNVIDEHICWLVADAEEKNSNTYFVDTVWVWCEKIQYYDVHSVNGYALPTFNHKTFENVHVNFHGLYLCFGRYNGFRGVIDNNYFVGFQGINAGEMKQHIYGFCAYLSRKDEKKRQQINGADVLHICAITQNIEKDELILYNKGFCSYKITDVS